jgi:thiol:disulfide interchange protein
MLSRLRSNTLPIVSFALLATAATFTVGCNSDKPAEPTVAAASSEPTAQTVAPASAPAPIPFVKKHLYSETADPKSDIAAALKQARAEKKRVILDFGGDWCGDCQVLDIYMHQSPNADLLDKHFIVVHVDIGHMDHNVDIPEKYGVPIKKGVPALAVLDAHGKLLYSQQTGEFEDMRHMDSASVTEFLNKWKA